IPFEKELSVIVARNASGEIKTFDAVECEFNSEANLVEFQFSPAAISREIEAKAQHIAKEVISKLNMVGLLAVEFFLTTAGELLVNEMAPRPHNSGHHTIECCFTSQFAQHLRAILNMPLGDTSVIMPGAMLNIIGEKGFEGPVAYEGLPDVLAMKGVYVHLYGKTHTKPFRKMGHVTILGKDLQELKTKVEEIKNKVKCISN
ncbi:MAG: ATP-grasp domain-containing protein, partial [Flavobacteriales bacterium]